MSLGRTVALCAALLLAAARLSVAGARKTHVRVFLKNGDSSAAFTLHQVGPYAGFRLTTKHGRTQKTEDPMRVETGKPQRFPLGTRFGNLCARVDYQSGRLVLDMMVGDTPTGHSIVVVGDSESVAGVTAHDPATDQPYTRGNKWRFSSPAGMVGRVTLSGRSRRSELK